MKSIVNGISISRADAPFRDQELEPFGHAATVRRAGSPNPAIWTAR